MRFHAPIFAVLAAIAASQSTTCTLNCITIPNGGLQVVAGQTTTLQWSNPSGGTITIKLQNGADITPSSGIVLKSNVDASAGTVTVSIPSDLPNSNQYTFETVSDSDSSVINFSPMFSIQGATGVSSMASSTATSASSSASTETSSNTSTMTESSSTMTSSMSTRTSSSSMSRTSSSATSTATTAVPNSNTNGASSVQMSGALMAMMAGLIAAF